MSSVVIDGRGLTRFPGAAYVAVGRCTSWSTLTILEVSTIQQLIDMFGHSDAWNLSALEREYARLERMSIVIE